ncbi:unnamed protein product [Oikopleura dioica]|uniref:VWFA domain-containing protein n=1 Tax=Oikopleura dioica TaxID=34765 RepID=E4XYK7_OIKDI|nr:unnamed protein product [Oikopleura dioica]
MSCSMLTAPRPIFNPLEDFEKVRQWIGKLVDTFDIEEDGGGTRVGVVIYSDAPRMEISLGNGLGKTDLIKAVLVIYLNLIDFLFAQSLMYERGNTLTGESIRYASEVAFSETSGARALSEGINRIMIVLTDGRAQDNVAGPAVIAQEDGIVIYAVGVGHAIKDELDEIASKPTHRHKFSVSEYGAIESIRSNLRRTICIHSICPNMSTDNILEKIGYLDEESHLGFDLLQMFTKFDESTRRSIENLLGEESSPSNLIVNRKRTQEIFPKGLPDQYTIVFVYNISKVKRKSWVRVLEINDEHGLTQMVIKVDFRNKLVTFGGLGLDGRETKAKFDLRKFKKLAPLFQPGKHKVLMSVNANSVSLYADCEHIGIRKMRQKDSNISLNGITHLSDETTHVTLDKINIFCDTEAALNSERFCCELPDNIEFCPLRTTTPSAPLPTSMPRNLYADQPPEDTLQLCDCPAGPPGPPGPAGPVGPPGEAIIGPQGPKGLKGECEVLKLEPLIGAQGETGSKGQRGDPGLPGIPGSFGNAGRPGDDGDKGDKGDRGESGPAGPKGQKGSSGSEGPKGEPGLAGKQGPPGQQGNKGAPGAPGLEGPQGVIGPEGNPGDQGDKGESGEKGNPGEAGIKGQKGSTGLQGQVGAQGQSGPAGIRGDAGDKGDKGSAGPPGIDGVIGRKGDSGAPGADGKSGSDGVPGLPGVSGPAGPRGPIGATGERGDEGIQGPQGPFGPKGDKGTPGSQGQHGLPGPPGYQGLVGPQGDDGQKGEPGPRGPQGIPGVTGPAGETGKDGQKGDEGPAGNPGSRGAQGRPGIQGQKGSNGNDGKSGEKGYKGHQGNPGRKGDKGPPGQAGEPGLPGLDGLQGRPGDPGPVGPAGKDGKKGEEGPAGRDGRDGRGRRGDRDLQDGEYGQPGPVGPPGPPGPAGRNGADGRDGRAGDKGTCDSNYCYQIARDVAQCIFQKVMKIINTLFSYSSSRIPITAKTSTTS